VSQDLRVTLDRLEAAGRLRRINTPVNPVFELASISRYAQLDPELSKDALLFENVLGAHTRVLANSFGRRDTVAIAMGIEPSELLRRGVEALDRPIPPRRVESAPCQEIVERAPDLSLETLGVCQNSEQDGGRYITAGVHITRNPDTGVLNVGLQRNQVHSADTLGIWMAPTHMRQHYALAEAKGQSLPVAIAIGLHPAILIASQFRTGFDEDELPAAGGLLGEPVEVVRCITSDLEVPAHAEIIIEGEVLPGTRHEEGPFGEFTRQYGITRPLPVVQVNAITRRRDAIYQNVTSGKSPEHPTMGALGREPSLFRAVHAALPSVVAVHMPIGSGANMHAWISIRKVSDGDAQKAAFAAFAHQDLIKHVIVVDDDIDIYDPGDMDYALGTRVQADRDIFTIPRVRAVVLDPAADEYAVGKGTVAKMIVDATKPDGAPTDRYVMADVPASELARVAENRAKYFGG
jgi:2,5-furandicarboxylate decarboxylase 1